MKILIIAPTPFFADKGTSIRILEEALSLEKIGHQIDIATYYIGKNLDKQIKSNIKIHRIPNILFWYKKIDAGADYQKIILDILLFFKILSLIIKKNPTIIHSHLHEGALLGWMAKKIFFWKKIKLVSDLHGSLSKEMISHNYLTNKFILKIFLTLENFINNIGDHILVSSKELNDEISKNSSKTITTILDGVNLDNYDIKQNKKLLKDIFHIPINNVIVTYTGSLIKNKGINYLLEAIPMVIESGKNVHFIIAGYPDNVIKEYIKKNNFEKYITLISPLSYFDLPKINFISDIGIDPKDSSVGQASGKILQYMGAQIPVVCFDKVNNREYLGSTAYYSKNVSGKGIADGILYFLNNPKEIEKIGKLSGQRAKQFSWDASAEKINRIYKLVN